MLTEAIKEKASDIHIETYERHLQIRFRVDGVLREILRPQRRLAALLISRIKVMASLDIAEKRIPQDGRMALRIGGRAVDVRVSTLPSSYGERVVLRLLDKNSVNLDLLTLGMPPALHQQLFERLCFQSFQAERHPGHPASFQQRLRRGGGKAENLAACAVAQEHHVVRAGVAEGEQRTSFSGGHHRLPPRLNASMAALTWRNAAVSWRG